LKQASHVPIRVAGEVLENSPQGGDNFRLRLRVPDWPGAQPGQFVMLSAGSLSDVPRSDPLLPRPMAVYRNAPESREVEVLYKRTGRGTQLLAESAPGERIGLVGPLGQGFSESPPGDHAILVGGGTGVASLYELAARELRRTRELNEKASLRVILGARSAADFMGREDLAALGIDVILTTEDGSEGTRGLVTHALESTLAELRGSTTLYACGPTPMMQRCSEIALRSGASCVVSLENNMACGFGVCLGCAAPLSAGGFALVCTRGPVFDARDIEWSGLP
jgi:dihydroorotate dehydrogenase electron transfer subunit